MSRKQLLALAVITLLVGLSPFVVWMIALSNSPFFDPAQSVNTCHYDEVNGKTNQQIADLIDYPLVTLNTMPEGVAPSPVVRIHWNDAGCFLFVTYANRADKTDSIQIMVYSAGDPPADEVWRCEDYEASHQAQFHFKSVCSTEVEYRGKRYAVSLDSQFAAAEITNWAQYLTVNQTTKSP